MFKLFFSILFLNICLISLTAETRIAFIDFKQVTEQYRLFKTTADELKTAETTLKKDLQTKWEAFEQLVSEAVTLQRTMNHTKIPTAEQFKKMRELEKKIESEKKVLRTYKADQENKFRTTYSTQTEKILKQIRQVTAQLAKEKGYDLVINKSDLTTHATSLVPYINTGEDLTQALVQKLNQENP
ncbi:MAG: OmpH family outer membrane protein [Verrucomicrobiae bacterium]|nr:OmpH family outer membrane protein [Verrucomicrobiae bacterium]